MRIGPKMAMVVSYVRDNPGCTKFSAGMFAWDSGKFAAMSYIYNPVNRAIKAGLINASWNGHKYSLTVV